MDTDNAFEIRLPASTQIVRVRLIRSLRAKRMTLRVQSTGSVCITIPAAVRGNTTEQARLFALKNLDWIDRQLEKVKARHPAEGVKKLSEYLRENPQIVAGPHVFLAEISPVTTRPFYVLRPQETVLPICVRSASFETDLQTCLKSIARSLLPDQVRELATTCGVSVGKISVRDQQSRWGSCTTSGNISLNWRLILLPTEIQRHVILHELAHRRHMNHSDDFWDLLARWDPESARHDAELRRKWTRLFNLGELG